MRILVDICLSPDWVQHLSRGGHTATHWSSIGAHDAKDREILEWAATAQHVVLTNDLDFGAILAVTGGTGPSVLQLRTDDLLADRASARVLAALHRFETELGAGALVSIDERRDRVAVLPLRRSVPPSTGEETNPPRCL